MSKLVFLVAFTLVSFVYTVDASSMSQEEIFYYFGLKNTGSPMVYEDGEGNLFGTMDHCRAVASSCSFTLRDTLEDEEVMMERFSEFMRLHRNAQ